MLHTCSPGIVAGIGFIAGAGYLIMSDTPLIEFLDRRWLVGLGLAAALGTAAGVWLRPGQGHGRRYLVGKQHNGYTEQGSQREQPPISAGLDAFAPVLEAWKQVFTSWSQLAETLVKAQQDAFASMISAANTTAKNINVDDRPDSELAFSGSRTTASAPDRIERDRR